MTKTSKTTITTSLLLTCAALTGGCLDAEPGTELDDPSSETTEVAATEQALGGQNLTHQFIFGGNIFAEHHFPQTPEQCSGFVRGTPTAQWVSQVGGYCVFDHWVTPGLINDCRAVFHAYTAGGGFGGTCNTTIEQQGNSGSFSYGASGTASATQLTTNRSISLWAGQTLTIGTCGVAGASFSGDTFLRLFDENGGQLTFNDDQCSGLGSKIVVTAPVSGTFQIRAGCFSSNTCSGTVAWSIQ